MIFLEYFFHEIMERMKGTSWVIFYNASSFYYVKISVLDANVTWMFLKAYFCILCLITQRTGSEYIPCTLLEFHILVQDPSTKDT